MGQGKDMKRPPPVVSLAERRRQRTARKKQMQMQEALAHPRIEQEVTR